MPTEGATKFIQFNVYLFQCTLEYKKNAWNYGTDNFNSNSVLEAGVKCERAGILSAYS